MSRQKNIFKKVAAVAVIVFIFAFIAYLYCDDYPLSGDQGSLEIAISGLVSGSLNTTDDVRILETIDNDRERIVFFQRKDDNQVYGFAYFIKGLNMRYRITDYSLMPIPYSAFVFVEPSLSRTELVIGGYNLEGIHSYGVQLTGDQYIEISDEEFYKEILAEAIFSVERGQFLTMITLDEFNMKARDTPDGFPSPLWPYYSSALYDENGNDISEEFRLPEVVAGWAKSGSLSHNVNFFPVVIFLLVLGAVVIGLILRKPPK